MKKRFKREVSRWFPKYYKKLLQLKKDLIVSRFKRNYPDTIIFEPSGEEDRKLYAQDNQDFIVYEHFFKNKCKGFFCDIGGNHPLKINNTRFFEECGWDGIAFEPLPYMAKLWKEHRRSKLFPFALSDKEAEVIFTIVKDATGWEDMLSFVKETRDVEYDYETKDIKVQTKLFREVMEEEQIVHIDYLSLDVEGHELNVLKGIDFNKVRINVLTIENNPSKEYWYGNEEIRKYMFHNNYILWGRIIGLDDIYVHREFLDQAT